MIRFGEAESGELMGDTDDVFLIDHHAVGLMQDVVEFRQYSTRFFAEFGIAVALDVGAHHAAARDARTDDGAGRHQAQVVVGLQFGQQRAHGGRLDVEAADGLALSQEVAHQRVVLKTLDVVYVDLYIFVLFDELKAVFDFGEPALTEDVEFEQADILRFQHAELCRGKTFGGMKVAV